MTKKTPMLAQLSAQRRLGAGRREEAFGQRQGAGRGQGEAAGPGGPPAGDAGGGRCPGAPATPARSVAAGAPRAHQDRASGRGSRTTSLRPG